MYDRLTQLSIQHRPARYCTRRLPEADVLSQLFLSGLRLGDSSGWSRLTSDASHCVSPAQSSQVGWTASAVSPEMVVVACWGGQIGGKTAAERLRWLPGQPKQGKGCPDTSCSSLQNSPCRPVNKPPTGSSLAQRYVTLLHLYHNTERCDWCSFDRLQAEGPAQNRIGCMQRCRC